MEESELFPATRPNGSVFIEILCKLVGTPRFYRYLLVITNRIKKMTMAVPINGVPDG